MNNFSKISIAFILLLFFSCQTDPVTQFESKQGYVQLEFLYADGSIEKSRMVAVKNKSGLRTGADNITIKKVPGGTELPAGDYGVVTVEEGAWLIVNSKANVQNWNIGHGAIVQVRKDANLLATGSTNLNGGVTFTVETPNFNVLGNVDIQNGGNSFESAFSFSCNEFQILDETSIFKINGCGAVFSVANALNLSSKSTGKFIIANGAQVVTNILNVNSPNVVTGHGSIKVLNTLNLNNSLTTSSDIKFCWVDGQGNPRPINNPANLGAAVRSCETTGCAPLPVKIVNLTAETLSETKAFVRFMVTENTGLSSFRVNYSTDGKTWKTKTTGVSSDLAPGREYVKAFDI